MTANRIQVVLVFSLVLGALVSSASSEEQDAVHEGQKVLQKNGSPPWYDPDNDVVRRFDVTPSEDDKRRHSRWAGKEEPAKSSNWAGGRWLNAVLRVLAWTLLMLLVIAVVWILAWAAMRAEYLGGRGGPKIESVAVGADRMENLPIPLPKDETDLLAAAKSYFNAGDLAKAIIYAFAYQLVELDKHELIRLSKGKTNRQYLGELKRSPRLADLVRQTMLAFEDVFFGHHELSRARFQTCWNSLDEFHRQLEQRAP